MLGGQGTEWVSAFEFFCNVIRKLGKTHRVFHWENLPSYADQLLAVSKAVTDIFLHVLFFTAFNIKKTKFLALFISKQELIYIYQTIQGEMHIKN